MIEAEDFEPTRIYHGVRDNPFSRPIELRAELGSLTVNEIQEMPIVDYINYRDLFSTYQLETNSFGPVLKQSRYGDYRTRFIYAEDPDEAAKFLELMLDEVTLDHPDLADAMFTTGIKPKYFDTYDLKARWLIGIFGVLVVTLMIIVAVVLI